MSVDRGVRSSSATSYLAPRFLNRTNLDVVLNTHATRIVQTNVSDNLPVFGEVVVGEKNSDRRLSFHASKEVILSAGVIGTPQLLLISGIGNSTELREVGVEPVHDLHDVGKNMSDHAYLGLTWLVNATETVDDVIRDPELYDRWLSEWETNKTGLFTSISNSFVMWGRVTNDSLVSDPSSGENSPHYGLYPLNGGFSREGHYLTFVNLAVAPSSRGTISLNTTNPFDQPLINPAYLSTEFDRLAMRASAKKCISLVAAPAWEDYIITPVNGLEDVANDEELDEFILKSAGTGLHGVGTASMSARDAGHGVVDPDLRLKKALGLRIVDASVLPYVPGGHTQAPVYIIAERAADLIKESWQGI
ncbi:hypothetical protein H0H93_011816 [Arthromyces matolae]|nr:hypothetical protein H0H93_011816 [Arthromyces matolae]